MSARNREILWIFTWSRAAVWICAIFALLSYTGGPHGSHAGFLLPIHDLGWATDVWARWDSGWFIRIARHGYAVQPGTEAFYPLYPALVAVAGRVLLGHYVLGGILVSLASTFGAFVLLERLANRLTDAATARRSVLYLAVFPMSLFLQAVYSESLFLLVAVGAFLAAEHRRFTVAGICCGLALLTRPTGGAVVLGILVLAYRSPRRWTNVAWTLVSVPMFALFPIILWAQIGRPFAWVHAERLWYRHFPTLGPIGGVVEALRAAWAGVLQLTVGSNAHPYWVRVDPYHAAAANLEYLAFFTVAVALSIVAWRRLGAAYGVMSLVAVAIPLTETNKTYPLLGTPRFVLAAFPIFIALATIASSERRERAVVGTSALLLGLFTVQWALEQFVS